MSRPACFVIPSVPNDGETTMYYAGLHRSLRAHTWSMFRNDAVPFANKAAGIMQMRELASNARRHGYELKVVAG